ncbi:MAG: AbrB/MazE/SpoVT family DNA-binding domain-containing protein [Chlamydiae bacterium]|nr:AbrB/MazE/SpoVT family DNA-binding domain-containing protein [Chlamydiota bacterium]MBI3277899.1 AbrB/MazE/SpoVT family DNA-binding domain-containing protein [Chlamydiota bacterium]
MLPAQSFVAEVKSRGQLTIPKKIRDQGYLEEGQVVSIIPLGDAFLVSPKMLELDEARRELRRLLKSSGRSLEELLEGLKETRETLYQERYGRKRH